MHEKQLKPHLQCGTDPRPIWTYPRMIRPHTRPSRNRRTAEVDHRGSGTHFVWKNTGFRASGISQKRISCETSSKTPSATPSTTCNAIYSEGTILQLQSTMEFHLQLLHQHHLQSHVQWGNDPRVANHNGIPSATHPPAALATPFTMREQSYSCKSQWNSVDHTCTKNSWNPIYNAEPIRDRSEHIRGWSDHTRDRLATVAPQR